MDKKYLKSFESIDLANLNKEQEEKLRQLEIQFNTEFGKDFYFMVMDKND
ncbi:polynucleotide phosphorylase [Clostridium omnivorum]|uniref:Uncharacterized protein n=1 Tax=Clostridium omnivorum TaxID=1604902 RepID=A0ABQ5NAB8_9CLOT|nr:polynucleotide phosphorylase [Clostridium sp. E14]GLC32163.1 hypothetical protein bsdE14_35730 [Clostridium sp. E14]